MVKKGLNSIQSFCKMLYNTVAFSICERLNEWQNTIIEYEIFPKMFSGDRSCKQQLFNKNVRRITFSNWCTLNIPLVSLPCEPTSCRKQDDKPQYFFGSSFGSIHSPLWNAAMGCSLVAIRYFSSIEVSSSRSLPLPTT